MRLGLFGGTFDPIHLGHLILAEQCREACRLDRVWFVVAGAPPHKRGDRTPVAHRLEMARIAIAGHQAFEVSDIEASAPRPPLQRRHAGSRTPRAARRRSLLPDRRRQPGRSPHLARPRGNCPPGHDRRGQPPRDGRSGSVRPAELRPRHQGPPLRDDSIDRHRLQGPAPAPGRAPNHPLHGSPRRRGLHRSPRPVSRTNYSRAEHPGPFGLIGIQRARMMPSRVTPSLSVTTSVDRGGPPSMPVPSWVSMD